MEEISIVHAPSSFYSSHFNSDEFLRSGHLYSYRTILSIKPNKFWCTFSRRVCKMKILTVRCSEVGLWTTECRFRRYASADSNIGGNESGFHLFSGYPKLWKISCHSKSHFAGNDCRTECMAHCAIQQLMAHETGTRCMKHTPKVFTCQERTREI